MYESPFQLYQDRIILTTDMIEKGGLLCTQKHKTAVFLKFCVYIIDSEVIGRCISEEINF